METPIWVRFLIALLIVAAGLVTGLVVLAAGLGFLVFGVIEITIVLVVLVFRPRPVARHILGVVLTVLLLLGAYGSLQTLGNYDWLPDPFDVNPVMDGADVDCGTPWDPGTDAGSGGSGVENDAGCMQWRDDRAVEGAIYGVLALAAAGATTVDWIRTSRRRRDVASLESP